MKLLQSFTRAAYRAIVISFVILAYNSTAFYGIFLGIIIGILSEIETIIKE